MKRDTIGRERLAWTATVAVLLTAAAWLAVVNVALLWRTMGADVGELAVTLRVLVRIAPLLLDRALPLVAAAVAMVLVVALIADAARADLREGAHHG